MSRWSIPFPFDKLGGLSHTKNIEKFSGSKKNISKVDKYLKDKIIPLKNYPKIVFLVCIFGAIIVTVCIVNLFLVMKLENTPILAIIIICCFLLIVLGGIGGYFESKWNASIRLMQREIIKMTKYKCAIEVGYVLRCSSNYRQPLNFCNSRQAYLILFDLENYPLDIKKGTIYLDESSEGKETKIILSPFIKTYYERKNLSMVRTHSFIKDANQSENKKKSKREKNKSKNESKTSDNNPYSKKKVDLQNKYDDDDDEFTLKKNTSTDVIKVKRVINDGVEIKMKENDYEIDQPQDNPLAKEVDKQDFFNQDPNPKIN